MSQRLFPVIAVAVLAAVLWVAPSIGSQGLGALGNRFSHVDRSLVEGHGSTAALRTSLQRADADVETALSR